MRKKVVFAPLSNTYSHIADCLAVADALPRSQYHVHFLTTRDKRGFIDRQGYETVETMELWQGRGESEVMRWFEDGEWFRRVVDDELQAFLQLDPDLVVGSYRYTTRLNCRRLGVPFFSITGPNMTPFFRQYLGIPPELMDGHMVHVMLRLYKERLEQVMAALPEWDGTGLHEMRSLLLGDRTFFHTIPEFEPLEGLDASCRHVGPMRWQGWKEYSTGPSFRSETDCKVLLFLGSVLLSEEALVKLAAALDRPGLESLVVAPAGCPRQSSRLHCVRRVDLEAAIDRCDIAVIHGGLNVVHHCLRSGTPCLVLPHQVEQAQNALRAEQIGIGRNLLGDCFRGDSGNSGMSEVAKRLQLFLNYQEQIGRISAGQIGEAVEQAVADDGWRARCRTIADVWRPRFQRYKGASEIAAAIREQLA